MSVGVLDRLKVGMVSGHRRSNVLTPLKPVNEDNSRDRWLYSLGLGETEAPGADRRLKIINSEDRKRVFPIGKPDKHCAENASNNDRNSRQEQPGLRDDQN